MAAASSIGSITLFTLLFLALFVSLSNAGGEGSLTPQQCPEACNHRCSKTSHMEPCIFFCNKCCAKCRCVPSGTYGHKEECPCYNNWKTKEGGPKCP